MIQARRCSENGSALVAAHWRKGSDMCKIERANFHDAAEILTLQKIAYRSEAEIYNDDTIAPLTQTLAEMQADLERQVVIKAVTDGRIVGSVRARQSGDTCYIGRLIVHPDWQNQGIGSRLMAEIERIFAQAARFELFTGCRSDKNLYLYQKLGYRPFKEQPVNEKLTLVFLEKRGG